MVRIRPGPARGRPDPAHEVRGQDREGDGGRLAGLFAVGDPVGETVHSAEPWGGRIAEDATTQILERPVGRLGEIEKRNRIAIRIEIVGQHTRGHQRHALLRLERVVHRHRRIRDVAHIDAQQGWYGFELAVGHGEPNRVHPEKSIVRQIDHPSVRIVHGRGRVGDFRSKGNAVRCLKQPARFRQPQDDGGHDLTVRIFARQIECHRHVLTRFDCEGGDRNVRQHPSRTRILRARPQGRRVGEAQPIRRRDPFAFVEVPQRDQPVRVHRFARAEAGRDFLRGSRPVPDSDLIDDTAPSITARRAADQQLGQAVHNWSLEHLFADPFAIDVESRRAAVIRSGQMIPAPILERRTQQHRIPPVRHVEPWKSLARIGVKPVAIRPRTGARLHQGRAKGRIRHVLRLDPQLDREPLRTQHWIVRHPHDVVRPVKLEGESRAGTARDEGPSILAHLHRHRGMVGQPEWIGDRVAERIRAAEPRRRRVDNSARRQCDIPVHCIAHRDDREFVSVRILIVRQQNLGRDQRWFTRQRKHRVVPGDRRRIPADRQFQGPQFLAHARHNRPRFEPVRRRPGLGQGRNRHLHLERRTHRRMLHARRRHEHHRLNPRRVRTRRAEPDHAALDHDRARHRLDHAEWSNPELRVGRFDVEPVQPAQPFTDLDRVVRAELQRLGRLEPQRSVRAHERPRSGHWLAIVQQPERSLVDRRRIQGPCEGHLHDRRGRPIGLAGGRRPALHHGRHQVDHREHPARLVRLQTGCVPTANGHGEVRTVIVRSGRDQNRDRHTAETRLRYERH